MSSPRLLAALLICLAGGGALRAQQYTHISGVIVDASFSSVPDATVSVVNEDTGFHHAALSKSDGGYLISSLEPGVYKITVRKIGFRTMIRFGIRVNETQPARVDFKLVVGSLQETITVEGSPALLNSDDASVGTVVGADQIERLPLNGGALLGLLELTPGLIVTPATRGEAGQFTVNGQRPNTHYFTVDGVSANSGVSGGGSAAEATGGSLPGMTAFGSLDSLVAVGALQEMRVQTSTTGADFGRLPGAQISLTSRSGSNELHGSLADSFRNDALDANDWFANQHGDGRAPLRLQDFSAALGGPLWRNRSFFFASYEGLRMQQPFVWNVPVPSLGARDNSLPWAEPLLNMFPAPNGPELGAGLAEWTGGISRPARFDAGAIRLDHAFTSRLTGFARFSETPSTTQYGSDPINSLGISSRSITGGLTLRARPTLVFDLRLNASSANATSIWNQNGATLPDCSIEPATEYFLHSPGICNYLVRFSIAGVGQVVSGSEGWHSQSQYQISPSAIWNKGTHAIRFGADYLRLAPVRNDATGTLSILADTVPDLASSSNFWDATSPQQYKSAVVGEISAFVQDTWRVTPRLTMTYGLRWEISPAPLLRGATSFDPATGQSQDVRRPTWPSTFTNFAPRFGIAYQLSSNGRTVLRAGIGSYFDSSLSLATDLVNDGPLSVSNFDSPRNGIAKAQLVFGFMPDLRLPLVKQWNASIEHAFDRNDIVTAGYVGSSGGNLIRREIGGPGSTNSSILALGTNHGESEYQSLQMQYRRRLASGLQALVSYAWAHSIDNSSTDAGLYWAGSGLQLSQDRASSDFDVRHSITAGFSYDLPASTRAPMLRHWALEGMFRARTGFPINILGADEFMGVSFENVFRPDLVPGQPLWITDPSAPGGHRINPAAFAVAPGSVQGDLGRNALNGFGMSQLDLAVRREFTLGEKRSIQLRIEAFNALNHANFADPTRFLASPLFGESSSMLNLMLGAGSPGSGLAPIFQSGGPRSLQVTVRFRF
ncbi:MAG TPA: TonB-dependent receptor [Bryobacteraceae bacterium]|nr:TonB-dependent receptor [Bryobacteraceae bacterium]